MAATKTWAWHTSPVKTYKDLYKHEMIVGSSGGTTTTVPLLLRSVLGMQFKVVKGYKSGGDVDLAIERGEIEGRVPVAWGGLKGAVPILLGLFAVTAHAGGADHLYVIVFVVVLASVIVQGGTIPKVANLCRVQMREVGMVTS